MRIRDWHRECEAYKDDAAIRAADREDLKVSARNIEILSDMRQFVDEWPVGRVVNHPTFGLGTIINADANLRRLTIDFFGITKIIGDVEKHLSLVVA